MSKLSHRWTRGSSAARPTGLTAAAVTLAMAIVLLPQPGRAQQPAGANASEQPAVEGNGPAAAASSVKVAPDGQRRSANPQEAIERIAASGCVLEIGETSSSRLTPAVRLAPGAPPILAFRYLDGQARHRFGDLDLVMDDAGH